MGDAARLVTRTTRDGFVVTFRSFRSYRVVFGRVIVALLVAGGALAALVPPRHVLPTLAAAGISCAPLLLIFLGSYVPERIATSRFDVGRAVVRLRGGRELPFSEICGVQLTAWLLESHSARAGRRSERRYGVGLVEGRLDASLVRPRAAGQGAARVRRSLRLDDLSAIHDTSSPVIALRLAVHVAKTLGVPLFDGVERALSARPPEVLDVALSSWLKENGAPRRPGKPPPPLEERGAEREDRVHVRFDASELELDASRLRVRRAGALRVSEHPTEELRAIWHHATGASALSFVLRDAVVELELPAPAARWLKRRCEALLGAH